MWPSTSSACPGRTDSEAATTAGLNCAVALAMMNGRLYLSTIGLLRQTKPRLRACMVASARDEISSLR